MNEKPKGQRPDFKFAVKEKATGARLKAEAHRLAHKLRDPKFYTARTKRAVNSRGAL